MDTRLLRVALAVLSILIASIVVGGMLVFLGMLLYRTLAEAGSPGLAVACLVVGSCLVGALVVILGHWSFQRALELPRASDMPAGTPEQMIAVELARLIGSSPTKLVVASLGVGFALGLSPRLRRAIYRSFMT